MNNMEGAKHSTSQPLQDLVGCVSMKIDVEHDHSEASQMRESCKKFCGALWVNKNYLIKVRVRDLPLPTLLTPWFVNMSSVTIN